MLLRQRWPVLLLFVACADDIAGSPVVEQGLVCGAPGPHRVLELDADADEQLYPRASVLRVDDRLIFVTGSGEHRPEPYFSPTSPPRTTVRSTGPCGEDPRIIGQDVSRIFTNERWPGHVFGCRGYHDLVILDPRGDADPVLVAAAACPVTFTDHGLVWYEHQQSPPEQGDSYGAVRAMFMPYPSDSESITPPVALLEDIPYTEYEGILAEATDNAVFALDHGDLVRISLPDGAVAVEQPGVHRFDVTGDGWFVVWQVGDGIGNAPPEQEGDISLRDRMTLVDREIGHGYIGFGRPIWFDRFVLPPDENRILVLPDATPHELMGVRRIELEIDDGRWLVDSGFLGPWTLLDPITGEQTPLVDRTGAHTATPDHLDIYHDDTELWRYPYDGGPPTQIAARRGQYTELDDGRLVMIVDPDERWFGDLALIDSDTLAEHRIDSRVSLAASYELWPGVFDPELVAYAVSDGDRSGVWLARPAP